MGNGRSAIFRTDLGWAGVALSDRGISMVVLPKQGRQAVLRELRRVGGELMTGEGRVSALPRDVQRAIGLLRKFFSGVPGRVDLPVDLRGHTDFQRAVWQAARAIPYGETRSYGWIAKRIGRPKASRAVGQAMGANPVPILVP